MQFIIEINNNETEFYDMNKPVLAKYYYYSGATVIIFTK